MNATPTLTAWLRQEASRFAETDPIGSAQLVTWADEVEAQGASQARTEFVLALALAVHEHEIDALTYDVGEALRALAAEPTAVTPAEADGTVARVASAIGALWKARAPADDPWLQETARTAITAMRDPTPAVSTAVMIAASRAATIFDGEIYIRGDAGESIVNAMVEAALK